jgi:hypothetical protein
MRILLEVGHPRLEESLATRRAPNFLAQYFLTLITDEGPITSGAPTMRLRANENPNASGAPTALSYKPCSQ